MTMSMPVTASAGRGLSRAQLAALLRDAAAGDWPALVRYRLRHPLVPAPGPGPRLRDLAAELAARAAHRLP